VTEREEAANILAELERQRVARMKDLIETQRRIAEHNRQKALAEQEKFGKGNQG
jgi:hypothetical protein